MPRTTKKQIEQPIESHHHHHAKKEEKAHERKPHRFRAGTVALREIKKYQKDVQNMIPNLPFQRLIQQLTKQLTPSEIRWSVKAMNVIHEAAEAYLIGLLENSKLLADHRNHVTVMDQDMSVASRIKDGFGFKEDGSVEY